MVHFGVADSHTLTFGLSLFHYNTAHGLSERSLSHLRLAIDLPTLGKLGSLAGKFTLESHLD